MKSNFNLNNIRLGVFLLLFVPQISSGQTYNWEWAYHYGGGGFESIQSLDIGPAGLIAAGGIISNTYLPMGSSVLASPLGNSKLFIGVYNPDGTPRWGIGQAGTGCSGVKFDPDGNIIAIGQYYDAGTNLSMFPVYGNGGRIFITKVDTLGNWIWTTIAGIYPGSQSCDDIDVDQFGNIYIIGSATANTQFGPFTLTSTGRFIAKLSSAGTFIWLKQLPPATGNPGSISVDSMGNVYSGFDFSGTINFNNQNFTAINGDALVSKMDATTGNIIWAKHITGSYSQTISEIAATPSGMLMVGGVFRIEIVAGMFVQSSYNGAEDGFLTILNPGGDFIDIKVIGGMNNTDYIYDIKQFDNNFWVSGSFRSDIIIEGITYNQGWSQEDEMFLLSYDDQLILNDIILETPTSCCNNNSTNLFALAVSESDLIIGGYLQYALNIPPFQLFAPNANLFIADLHRCLPPVISISPIIDSTLCQGDTVTLSANLMGSGSFQWYENGNPIQGAISSTYITGSPGSYIVIATESYGCADTSNAQFLLAGSTPNVSILANGPTTICDGNDEILYTNIPFSSYLWSTGETTSQINVSQPGSYIVTVTNSDGCTGASQLITISNFPPVTVPTITESNCTLTVSPLGYIQYKWYFNGNVIQGVNTPTYNATTPGNYSVEVMDTNDCTATSFSIQVNCPLLSNFPQNLETAVKIYPNPTSGQSTVSFSNIPDKKVELVIYDIFGREESRISYEILSYQGWEVTLPQLDTGVHFIFIESKNFKSRTKLIVI